jgi:hypothetical protein
MGRRYFPSRKPYLVTNRTAEGLPFVANLYINLMLYGIIARARFKHPEITVCGFIFLANHYHMLLVLNGDPGALRDFMNFVDGEIAKLVVRWLAKRNYKVWAQTYHAAPLLTAETAFAKMLYLFANPIKAQLAAKAAEWFGCSSWYALEDPRPRKYKCILSKHTPRLPNGPFSKRLVKKLLADIEEIEDPVAVHELPIFPFAWMDCFNETRGKSKAEMKQRLYRCLERAEKKAAKEREKNGTKVPDPELLATQNPHRPYKPKKFGRRVFCISSCPILRVAFIQLYRELCLKAREAYEAWRDGFDDLHLPIGMFHPPRGPRGSILLSDEFS